MLTFFEILALSEIAKVVQIRRTCEKNIGTVNFSTLVPRLQLSNHANMSQSYTKQQK